MGTPSQAERSSSVMEIGVAASASCSRTIPNHYTGVRGIKCEHRKSALLEGPPVKSSFLVNEPGKSFHVGEKGEVMDVHLEKAPLNVSQGV